MTAPRGRRTTQRRAGRPWAAAVALAGLLVVTGTAAADAPSGSGSPAGSARAAAPTSPGPVAPSGPGWGPGAAGTPPGPVPPGSAPVLPVSTGSGAGAVEPLVEPVSAATALPDGRARIAVRVAMAQLGLPYIWGGNGPTRGDAGFDCSGLTTFAYGRAGIALPRTAHTQFRAGPRVPAGAPLHPGDLVFYGTAAKVHHVGMYLGNGRMVNAPTFGKPVQTAYYRWSGDDYIGASRPASSPDATALLPAVPEAPDPDVPDAPPVFAAPAAPRPTAVPDPVAPQPGEADSAAASVAGSDADIAAGRVPAPPRPAAPAARTVVAAPPAVTGTPRPTGPAAAGTAAPESGPVPPPPVAPGSVSPAPGPGPVAARTTTTGPVRVPAPSGPPRPGAPRPGVTAPPITTAPTRTPAPGPTSTPAPSPAPAPTTAPRTPTKPVRTPAAPVPTTSPAPPAPTGPSRTPTASPTPTSSPAPPPAGTPTPTPTSRPTPSPTPVKPTPTRSPAAPGSTTPSPTTTTPQRATTVRSITLGGRTVALAPVPRDATGLPARPGAWAGGGRWVVRLAAPAAVTPGSTVTLTLADGRTTRWTVRSTTTAPAARAATARGRLVVLAPSGPGRWTVLVAAPAS